MKKLHILIPSIMAITSMPFVSLIGCSDPIKPEPEVVKFTTSEGQMNSKNTGTFNLSVEPSSHTLTFASNSWSFSDSSVGKAENVSYNEGKVTIEYANDITSSIESGTLTFTYDDITTGEKGIAVTINNIYLAVYTPPRLNFNTCSWEEIKHICDMYELSHNPNVFIDNFYFDDLSTPDEEKVIPTKIEDFAGQQRYLYLDKVNDSNKYYVRVLGVGQDYYEPTNNNAFVGLTFQFDTLFHENGGYMWNNPKTASNANYWESEINNKTFKGAILKRIKCFSGSSIETIIKPVYRTAICNNRTVELSPAPVSLFMPLLANIFSTNGLSDSFAEPSLYINEGQRPNAPTLPTTQYTYFKNKIGDGAIFNQKDNLKNPKYYPVLYKETLDKDSNHYNYWLTTPYITTSNMAFYVRSIGHEGQGQLSTLQVNTTPTGIAPCFCI